ncbi:rbr-type e3 ubiquitin transferase [Anaeramoeba flamelloides]|uniref:RBR-type E3 ubiquitin transferase n=1 Tax=Anaeramoeba flamelloides TaxID=1746091 RepID=A0ABQ8XDH3_9EUKA|nr:rbr-type e3 ubiquitin transferase [Anaeramoeba flamelloides]
MATREIKCPLQSCSQPFSRKDIRKWVTGDLYEKYNHYRFVNQIRRDPKFCACPFRDCLGYVLHDQKTKFPCVNCPKCNNDFCSVCKSEWHHEFTCKEAQAIFDKHSPEKKSLDFLQKNAKKCPKCQSPIIKSEGCDHITCTCNFQFCYSCLENWEECQKGKGHKEGCVFRWY